MDPARRYAPALKSDDPGARIRSRSELPAGAESLEKVLRFSVPPRGAEIDRLSGLSSRDIAQAMDLVHHAAASIRMAEEKARDGQARTQALLQRATEELKSAESRVQIAEGRTQAAEARCRAAETRAEEAEERIQDAERRVDDAEARAHEAENWLRQIFSTISDELPAAK